ncbi:MAG: S8 family serine peptidase, partial [Acidobacteria bacterium]|nr:S8 family serine peptidase [Acidobacteriota bacterium]
ASSQMVPAGVERIGAAPGVLSVTGAGVGVAIVDTGIDFSHPDLGMAPEVAGDNAFNASGGSCQDIHGHGTHVAGIVAARDNTIDVVGVAPDATLYCVNVFKNDPLWGLIATDESLVAGLGWIASHANQVDPPIRVVNMSLGRSRTPDDDDPNHPLHLAVKALYDINISVVVSAGNDSTIEVFQQVPASYPEVMAIASTTALDGVNGYDAFFVPCAGEQNVLADTASYFSTDGAFSGTGVTVSAPGNQREDIFEYLGTCFVESIGILSTWPGAATTELSGTSMASPHVAGVVALMWEKELGLNLGPEFFRNGIRDSVDRPGTVPLDSAVDGYTFDGEREGVVWAPAAVGDAASPEPDLPPTVTITSPADGSTFDPGNSINFQGSATDPEDGNIANFLVWTSSRDGQIGTGGNLSTTLSGGVHTITASVTDAGGNVVRKSINLTVGSSTSPAAAVVSSITYAMQGTNLLINVELDDEFGGPVAGAVVSVQLYEWLWGTGPWTADGTTNTQGVIQFQLSNAPWGCYVTTVTDIVADGLTWDGITPDNSFCN